MGNYLHFLEAARLIWLAYPAGISIAGLQKPEKIYMHNTNLLYAMAYSSPSPGTIREVFFYNHLMVDHRVNIPPKGDFLIDDTYLFEIGGKNKSASQITGIPESYVVKDDIEYPAGKNFPLWLFGFIY